MTRHLAPSLLFAFALLFLSASADAQRVPRQPVPVVNYTAAVQIIGSKPGAIAGTFKQYSNVAAVGSLFANGVPDNTAMMVVSWKFPTVTSMSSGGIGRYAVSHPPPHISAGSGDPTTVFVTAVFYKNGLPVQTANSQFVRVP